MGSSGAVTYIHSDSPKPYTLRIPAARSRTMGATLRSVQSRLTLASCSYLHLLCESQTISGQTKVYFVINVLGNRLLQMWKQLPHTCLALNSNGSRKESVLRCVDLIWIELHIFAAHDMFTTKRLSSVGKKRSQISKQMTQSRGPTGSPDLEAACWADLTINLGLMTRKRYPLKMSRADRQIYTLCSGPRRKGVGVIRH